MTKLLVTTLKMYALPEAVAIPFVQQVLDDDGRIEPSESMSNAANAMLDELVRVEAALRVLRPPVS